MEQVNARMNIDPAELHLPLCAWRARQGHNFVAVARGVPADVSGVYARVFREHGAYFDITATEHPGGDWKFRIPAACFPDTGTFSYEIHAKAADGEPCALGSGRLLVAPFSTTATPEMVGAVMSVAKLPCEDGGFVDVVMKWDGFAWVAEAVRSAAVRTVAVTLCALSCLLSARGAASPSAAASQAWVSNYVAQAIASSVAERVAAATSTTTNGVTTVASGDISMSYEEPSDAALMVVDSVSSVSNGTLFVWNGANLWLNPAGTIESTRTNMVYRGVQSEERGDAIVFPEWFSVKGALIQPSKSAAITNGLEVAE